MPIYTSGGLMALGGIGEGLEKGVDSFLKVRGLMDEKSRRDQQARQQQQQMGLMAAKSGYQLNPDTGEFAKTADQALKDEAGLAPLKADSPGSQLYRGLLKANSGGVEVPDNLTEAESSKALDAVLKANTARETAKLRNALMGEAASTKRDDKVDALAKALQKDLDPDASRTGNFGQISNTYLRSQKLKALATEAATGRVQNLDRRQQEELALGLANMLGGGNATTDSRVTALVPHTAQGNVNKFTEWYTGNPTGLDQQEFTKRMLDTVNREADVASQQMHDIRKRRLGAHSKLRQVAPDKYKTILNNYDLDGNGNALPAPGLLGDTTKGGYKPGDVVSVKGTRYRVGADGDSLEPM